MHPNKAVFILPAILLLSVLLSIGMADVAEDPSKSKTEATPARAEFESLLDLMRIGPRQLAGLTHGTPLHEKQKALVLRVLLRLDDLPPEDIRRWARAHKDVATVPAEADSARGQFFHLSGKVVSVETVKLSPEDARRLPFKQYYRVRMVLDGGKPTVEILTRSIPRAWLKLSKQNNLTAPASAVGMFLRLSEDAAGRNEPVFAARRIAWHPHTPLGQLGMDVGLLESLRDRKKIDARERECFYQMLAAVGRAGPGQLMQTAREELKREGEKSFSVVPLFNDPDQQRGRLVMLSGTARRVVKVHVKDADIVRRHGIRYYYEIYLYTPDSQDNPLVFCVRDLPEGMPAGSDPQYNQQLKVAGFFLKTWAFRPEKAGTPDGDPNARQLAPLLIGREPLWIEPPKSSGSNPWLGAAAGGLFILVLLAIWLAVWRSAKKDRQLRHKPRPDSSNRTE